MKLPAGMFVHAVPKTTFEAMMLERLIVPPTDAKPAVLPEPLVHARPDQLVSVVFQLPVPAPLFQGNGMGEAKGPLNLIQLKFHPPATTLSLMV